HRVGAAPADAVGVARAVTGHRELRLHGLYTHFAVADEPARDDFTDGQLASLLGVADALAADGIRPAMLHAANSAGAIAHPASRRLSPAGGGVLVRGARRPIAGTVTMDQIMVDCGPGSPVAVGDEVVLIGEQGHERITAWEWAERTDTIAYEVLCGVSARVPRTYVR